MAQTIFEKPLDATVAQNTTDITNLKSDLGIVEDGDTAIHAIAAGQYVIWKGELYTADAAISVGETLASSGGSSNLTAVSDGGLNALNNKIANLGTWVHDGIVNGNKTVTVPNTWQEINIYVFIENNHLRMFTFHVVRGQITTDTYMLRNGYYDSNNNFAYVGVNFIFNSDLTVTVSLNTVTLTGVDKLSSTYFGVKHKNKLS